MHTEDPEDVSLDAMSGKRQSASYRFLRRNKHAVGATSVCVAITVVIIVTFALVIRSKNTDDKPCAPTASSNTRYNFASLVTDQDELESHITDLMGRVDPTSIRSFMKAFSTKPHIAGSPENNRLASLAAKHFREFGFDHVEEQVLPVLLAKYSYRSVNVSSTEDASFHYECGLNEINLLNQTDWEDALKPANGYSGNGTAEGRVIWANYGRQSDFEAIKNVDLTGAIVVVRYGKIFRGDKVRLAERRGAAGVLIVNDPADVGPPRGKVFPDGPWASNTTVQRGSVYKGEGDPLTPSWPSEFGGPTLEHSQLYNDSFMDDWTLPAIPVQPMGWGDAMQVLKNIGGTGSNPLPSGWNDTAFTSILAGGIGPGAAHVKMEIRRDLQQFNITNVFGTIYGAVEPDRTVLFGSHRDAWTYGAEDPISGQSINLEIARHIGALHKTGWRPRRSIQVCSWDAEEWAIIGSIEYVESTVELLRQRAVAYLNLDVAVSGNQTLSWEGTPLLQSLAEKTAGDVTAAGKKLSDIAAPYGPAGSGTDHVGFIQLAGVPVLTSSIFNEPDDYESVYHSNYDSLYWVDNFGDPGFTFHAALAKLHLNMVMRIAGETLIPFQVTDYATKIKAWGREYADVPSNSFAANGFAYLQRVSDNFAVSATKHDAWRSQLTQKLATDANSVSPLTIRAANDITFGVERVFIADGKKETGQQWFKHVIFTPSAVNSYAATRMPLIAIGLATKSPEIANFNIGRVGQFIRRAALYCNSTAVTPYPV